VEKTGDNSSSDIVDIAKTCNNGRVGVVDTTKTGNNSGIDTVKKMKTERQCRNQRGRDIKDGMITAD